MYGFIQTNYLADILLSWEIQEVVRSCTVAGLVRWSIEAANIKIKIKNFLNEKEIAPNTRFIMFDPNGEYSKCF